MKTSYELRLKSKLTEVRRVEKFVKKLAAQHHFSEARLHDVMLVITEATNNAILHGNKLDAKKRATLRCTVDGNRLLVEVHDEGNGFDPDALPNPLAEENLLKPSGRGVFLIKQLAEDVRYEFSKTGTTVRFAITFRN
ncbi:MAG: ATP-binding protein [Chloroherpetonaceae bacterium]|nr:ATP-binding protein [Chloroherpetonaceae bacterium]MCS7210139.1 ATP-binding protein [Chloroherpetonaceae bacterium]MDW8019868.1 ATP-binding protein [Chloroherpetonaceae bacterium]